MSMTMIPDRELHNRTALGVQEYLHEKSLEQLASEGTKVSSWNVRPFQLVSLLDMLPFTPTTIYYGAFLIRGLQVQVMQDKEVRGSGDNIIPEEYAEKTREIIEQVSDACNDLGLRRMIERLRGLSTKLPNLAKFYHLSDLLHELRELDTAMMADLGERYFFYMPSDRIEYYEQDELFGLEVKANFQSTEDDVREAGSCYATGRNTACVFHCMRVLEKGLHTLVHELNNTFSTNITFNKGVEHTNWGNIIDKIDSEIRELLKPTRQPRLSQSDLQFYSQAAKEFVYFKNAWRDDVSHSRSYYDENEAKAVIEHVRAFMRQLATRLHE